MKAQISLRPYIQQFLNFLEFILEILLFTKFGVERKKKIKVLSAFTGLCGQCTSNGVLHSCQTIFQARPYPVHDIISIDSLTSLLLTWIPVMSELVLIEHDNNSAAGTNKRSDNGHTFLSFALPLMKKKLLSNFLPKSPGMI